MNRLIFLLSIATTLFHPALAQAASIQQLLERPLIRFLLMYTSEGSAITDRVIGPRLEEALSHRYSDLTESLTSPEWSKFAKALAPQLEMAELKARAELVRSMTQPRGARRVGNFLDRMSKASADVLTLSQNSTSIQFTTVVEPRAFTHARLQFMNGASTPYTPGSNLTGTDLRLQPLAGKDLRFSRLNHAHLGTLRRADLRGADLRNALVSKHTQLEGAIYDQFTGLPFSRSEASARGMKYVRSEQPVNDFKLDRISLETKIEASSTTPPEFDEEVLAASAFKEFSAAVNPNQTSLELFSKPRHIHTQGSDYIRFEVARFNQLPQTELNSELISVAEELQRYGGELRFLLAADPSTGRLIERKSAYFRQQNGKPIIAITEQYSSSTLQHELQHARDWVNLQKRYLDQGYDAETALQLARKERATAAYKVFTERNAVRAGLKAEARADDLAGVPIAERRWRFENDRFSITLSYPEREGLRVIFKEKSLAEVKQDHDAWRDAELFCRRIIRNALNARRAAFLHFGNADAAKFDADELFYEIIGGNRGRYASDGSLQEIRRLFLELLPSQLEMLPQDAFRSALPNSF